MTSKKHGGFVNENLTVQAIIFLKKTNLCLPLPQRFQKTFAHKNKHPKTYLN